MAGQQLMDGGGKGEYELDGEADGDDDDGDDDGDEVVGTQCGSTISNSYYSKSNSALQQLGLEEKKSRVSGRKVVE